MNTKFMLAALFSMLVAGANGKDVTGKVVAYGAGLPNVVVTDGTRFTTTGEDGAFSLAATDDARFVYIVTPTGYVANYASGTPVFYKPLNAKDFTFELFRHGNPNGTYTMFAVGDTQPGSEHDYERMEKEAFPEMGKHGKEYQKNNIPVAAVFLGDLVWDNLDTYARYKTDLATLPFPVYPVIGNHDHDARVNDDLRSAAVYNQYFGPEYYAFNMGNDHYIVLDDIIYQGNKQYQEGITQKQIDWVKAYTKYLPKGAHVFVAMHAPAYNYEIDKKLDGADQLMDALAGYDVSFLSGHTHIHSNIRLRPNVVEHMVGAVCGAWWIWDSQHCKDGTPLGYQVFESSPKGIKNYYKSLHFPNDYQFAIYPEGLFPGHNDKFCVKVWNWDPAWKVEWYEDGKYKGQMKQFASADPNYTAYLDKEYARGKKPVGRFRQPVVNKFSFFAAQPSKKAKVVRVVVTDRHGKQYTEEHNY